MSVRDFLDTNVLVYAYDSSNPSKQRIAQDLIRQALTGGSLISVQVLAELSTTLLHKVKPAARSTDVAEILDSLSPVDTISPDAEMVRRAVEVHAEYGLHFYDGMIVAAAQRGECTRILSEDLNAGQRYLGIVVENPFA